MGYKGIGLGLTAVAATALTFAAPASSQPSGSSDSSNDPGITTMLDSLGLGSSGSSGGGQTPTPCNVSTQSGSDGITDTYHDIGQPGPVSFTVDYNTHDVPDDIQVFYNGGIVTETGWVGNQNYPGQGQGTLLVNLPSGTSNQVLVRVLGGTDTIWEYTVNCPA